MSRIGTIVRRLYAEELTPAADKIATGRAAPPSSPKTRGTGDRIKALKKAFGNQKTLRWTIRVLVIAFALFIAAEAVFQYNRLTAWITVVTARRADVERELQRRQNLIPNLVYAVSKYATYEQGVFKYVSDARETLKMIRSSGASRTSMGGVLEQTLSRLVALAEQYPDLKATQSIQDLIKEASNTENRVADAKKEHNKACEIYNQYRTIFPGNLFAFVYRFGPAAYIGMEEKLEVPIIDLNVAQLGADVSSITRSFEDSAADAEPAEPVVDVPKIEQDHQEPALDRDTVETVETVVDASEFLEALAGPGGILSETEGAK